MEMLFYKYIYRITTQLGGGFILFVLLFVSNSAPAIADTLTLHPSGANASDNASYTSSAASNLDTNDGNTTVGSSSGTTNDLWLEIDDTAQTGAITSVQVKAVVNRNSIFGTANFDIDIKSGATTDSDNANHGTSSSTYATYSGTLYTTDPNTGSAWTWAAVNSLIAIVDHTDTTTMRVTELYVEVIYVGDSTAPDSVTLSTGTITDETIELTWNAPGDDGATGTATTYDVRYSTSAINDGNWASATQATGEPSPSVATTAESFVVTGLTGGTTYYFAIKTGDEIPNWSAISNSPSAATTTDSTAPSAISNLATSNVTETTVDLSWRAPGDDASTGTATSYDIRYSTSDITNDTEFNSATQVTGEPTPTTANTTQEMTVTGLSSGTTYYFAIKTSDEVPNTSSLSNVPSTTTTGSDTTAPSEVVDLVVTDNSTTTLDLSWTAPGDDYDIGTATTYDIRYSTSAITDGNWASATQATGEPSPSAAGSSETFTITGLSASTTYYVAIKTDDEVPNTSSLSDNAVGTTSSTSSLNIHPSGSGSGHGASCDTSTSSVLDSNNGSECDLRDSGDDVVVLMDNPTPVGSVVSITMYTRARDRDGKSDDQIRFGLKLTNGGTTYWGNTVNNVSTSETLINGGTWTQDPSDSTDWTWSDMDNLISHIENTNGNAEHSVDETYFEITYTTVDSTAPDAVSDLATGSINPTTVTLSWTSPGDDGATGTASSYDIRYATSAISNDTDFNNATQVTGEPAPSVAGTSENYVVTGLSENTTYYFAIKTADETPNWASLSNSPSATTTISDSEAPDAVSDLAATNPGPSTIDLSWTAPGDDGATGTATSYDIRYRTDAAITSGNWDSATQVTGEPGPSVAGTSESFTVTGLSGSTTYYFAFKTVDDNGNWSGLSNSPNDTTTGDGQPPNDISDLATGAVSNTTVQLTWTAPGDDNTTGTSTTYDVRYSTSTITAGNWASATQVDNEPTPSAYGTSESMYVTGLTAGTTYYFAIMAADDVVNWNNLSNVPNTTTTNVDEDPPAQITDVNITATAATTVDLAWTATGDDASTGTATSYDIRYSTSAITEGNWNSATQTTGEPSPSASGSSESFQVTGLTADTTYYFGIKAFDDNSNESPLSNVPSGVTTTDPAPGEISDLGASAIEDTSITLSWTASGEDDYTGTATSYDVRYSTSAITEGNWASATQATGEPTPSAAYSTDTLAITGLTADTTYYFAVKVSDAASNESGLSNIFSVTTNASGTGSPSNVTYYLRADSGTTVATGISTDWSSCTDYSSTKETLMNTSAHNCSGQPRFERSSTGVFFDMFFNTAYTNDTLVDGTSFKINAEDKDSGNGQIEAQLFYVNSGGTKTFMDSPVTWNVPSSRTNHTFDLSSQSEMVPSGSKLGFRLKSNTTHQIRIEYGSGNSGYGGELRVTETPETDTTAPAALTDLAAGNATANSIQLTWTAPGDDNNAGFASSYDIRYSTSAITEGNWASATTVTGEPTPGVAGSAETFTVTGLSASTTYYFAIKTDDDVPQTSAISNSPSATTTSADATAPAAITDLAINGTPGSSSIKLTWTSPGDDTNSGTASTYDVRYSTSAITEGNWASATTVTGEPSPQAAGNTEFFTVNGLSGTTTYYFAIKTSDEVPNTSAISNSPNDTTAAPPSSVTVKFHPSGSHTSDNVTYTGGTAATAMDTSDGSTSYGFSTGSGNDYYSEIDDTSESGTINSVIVKAVLQRQSGYNTISFAVGLRTYATNYLSGTQTHNSTTYTTFSGASYATNPNTGSAWTWQEIDDIVAVVDHNSGDTDNMRVTELYVEVNYTPGDTADTIAPAAISDLATGTVAQTSIDLSWTAPGDDNDVGTASVYDIRYSTSAITATNWAYATQATGEPTPSAAGSLESMTVTGLSAGTTYYFAIKTKDEVPNDSDISNFVNATTIDPPVGGYTADNVIPQAQAVQATDGTGDVTITWKGRDNQSDGVTLNGFQYSVDGGSTWQAPGNDDASAALSANWDDNGSSWSTAATFGAATAHSFTFTTKHGTLTGLADVDQSDVQVRFKLNDGTADSASYVTSESFSVDNASPTATITSSEYDADTDTLTITGTNFTTIATASTDIKTYVDWTKFSWDINGDNATTADISFVVGDVTSLTVTNDTTLTLVFAGAKGTAIEATSGYGSTGGDDKLDINVGFTADAMGNVSTTDAANNADLVVNDPPVGGYTADDVIPAAQITQATDGSGLITIKWKGRDNQSDNVTLNSFEYSVDGGVAWNAPTNADASASLSTDWDDDGGSGWSTAATFGAASFHSFTFNTKHADTSGLDGVDQTDVQVRFKLNDGKVDSASYVTSEDVAVDDESPTATITSASYNAVTNAMTITGTNFTTIAPASTDIKSYVDWTKFVWDINGDDGTTADISFVVGDITSLTVTDATTLTLEFSASKAETIENNADYSVNGGADTLDVTAGFSKDDFGNAATTDGVADGTLSTQDPPIGGYVDDNAIPSTQITQATDGSGVITINWKGRDNQSDNVTLGSFEYSVDDGSTWNVPTNGDGSAAFSANWTDNGGGGYTTATTLAAATAHSFTLDTQHADLTGLDGVDQSDVMVRFILNDGTYDSGTLTSAQFRVDNELPTTTITSAEYDPATDTITITGTNFATIAAASTDIKSYVDWSKFVWDINGDDATTANITFVVGDVTSLTVTDATTLTLVFTGAKGTAIEATAGYGATGGADTLDVTAGFSIDAFGNIAATDAVADGTLSALSILSGTVYSDEGSTAVGANITVRLLVNGVSQGTVDTNGSGVYSFTTAVSAADKLLVYVDENDADASTDAVTVTVSGGNAISDLDLYYQHLITRHDNAGSLTNALMKSALEPYSDTEIFYSVDGSNVLTATGNNEIYIPATYTYAPGANFSAVDVKVLGTLTAGANSLTLSGDWDSFNGTFNRDTSTLVLNGTSNTFTPKDNQNFHHMTIGAGADIDVVSSGGSDNFTVYEDLTINGSLTVPSGFTMTQRFLAAGTTTTIGAAGVLAGAGTFERIMYNPTLTFSNNTGITIDTFKIRLTYSNDNVITIPAVTYGGDLYIVAHSSSSVAEAITIASGTLAVGGDLVIESSTNDTTSTTLRNSDNDATINVTGNLTVGNASTSGDTKFVTGDATITVGGNITIIDDAESDNIIAIDASDGTPTISVGGNWDSSGGTFTYGSSTVDLTGTGNLKTPGADYTAYFYNLNMAAATKTTTLQSHVGVANVMTLGIGSVTGAFQLGMLANSGSPLANAGATVSTNALYYRPVNGTVTVAGGNYDVNAFWLWPSGSNAIFNLGAALTTTAALTVDVDTGNTGVVVNTQNYDLTTFHLDFGEPGYDGSSTMNFGSSTVDVNGRLSVGNNGGSHTLNLGSAAITVGRSWTASQGTGTLTVNPGTSTVTLDGSLSRTLDSGGSAFNNLVINKTDAADANDNITVQTNDLIVNGTLTITDGELIQQTSLTSGAVTLSDASSKWTNVTDNANVTLAGDVSNSGTITFDAPTGDLIQILSSVGGTQRNWQGGGTFTMTDVDVQDQTAIGGTPASITVTSGTNSGNNVNWLFGSNSIGGTAYSDDDEATTLNNKAITVVVYDGTNQTSYTTTTNGSGVYSVASVTLADTDIVSVYLNDETEEGATVFKSDGNNVANLNVYQNHVSIRSDSGVISNAEIATADDGDDDVKLAVAGNDITLDSNLELFVFGGSGYTPGGDVTTQGASGDVDIRGTVTAGANTFTVSGDWDSSLGTFTENTSTVVMTGASNSLTSASDFDNLTIEAGAVITAQSSFIVRTSFIVSGTLNIASSKTLSLQVADFTLNAGGILGGAGTFRQRVNSNQPQNVQDAILSGTISVATYIFDLFNSDGGAPGIPITGANYQGDFKILTSGNSTTNYTYITGGDLTVGGTLTVSTGLTYSSFSVIVDNSQENRNITAGSLVLGDSGYTSQYSQLIAGSATVDINGNVTIYASDGGGDNELDADSSSWTVSGNWINNDLLTADTSTFTFDGTTSTTIDSGGDAFNNLLINKTSGTDANDNLTVQTDDLTVNGSLTITDGELIQQRSITTGAVTLSDASSKWTNITDNTNVTLAGDVSNSGTISFDAATSDLIQIRSSVNGTQRNWQGSGTFSMTDVDVKDQTAIGGTPANIVVSSGTDSSNNINWMFGSNSIGGTAYTDDDEATTLNSKAVTVVVYNGSSQTTYTTTTNGSGVYSISNATLASGDIVNVYLNDETEEGVTVLESDGVDVADLNVYQNHVGVRSQVGVISNADLGNVDDGDDDVKYSVSANDATFDSGFELFVFSGSSYTPGGDVTTQGATGDVDMRGTLNAGANTFTISGDWTSSAGTFNPDTSLLKLTGSNKAFNSASWPSRSWNLTIGDGVNPASVTVSAENWRNVAGNALVVEDNSTLTLTASFDYLPETGTLTLGTGATLNITTNLTRKIDDSSSHISTGGTISGGGTFQYQLVAGSSAAPVTARTYDVDLAIASGDQTAVAVLGGGASLNLGTHDLNLYDQNTNNGSYGTLDNSGNIPITAADLNVATSQSGGNLPTKTGKLICRGATYTFTNVTVFSSNTSAPTLDCLTGGESSTWNVSGDVSIDASRTHDGVLTAGASTWNVGGNWDNTSTFTAGTSTVTLNGTTSATLASGGSAFNNLAINKTDAADANDNLTVQTDDLTINGTLTVTDGELVQQRSITTGAVNLASATSKWTNVTNNANVTLSGNVSNSGTISFDAPTGDLVQIRSSVGGTQRNWQGSGTFTMTDVDVQDQTAIGGTPANITVTSGTNSGNNINWLFGSNSIAGIVYTDDDEATTLNNKAITVVVYDGSSQTTYTTTTNGSGAYSVSNVALALGDIVMVYLNDETEEGVTVLESDGADVADLNVYQNHVGVRSQVGTVSNADMGNVDDGDDDVKYAVSGGNLTLDSGYELYVFSASEFAPGGNVTTQGAGGNIEFAGTLTLNTETVTVADSWTRSGGTINVGTSEVKFTGSGTINNFAGGAGGTVRFYDLTLVSGSTMSSTGTGYGLASGGTLTIEDNATFTTSGFITLQTDSTLVMGTTNAVLTVNGTFWRYVDNTSANISTNGTINGSGTFAFVGTTATPGPATVRTYDCDVSIYGIAATDVVQLSGSGTFALGSHDLYIHDTTNNIGSEGIVDTNSFDITSTGTLYVGRPDQWFWGTLRTKDSTLTFADVVINDPYSGGSNAIDASTGASTGSTWNISGDVTINATASLTAGPSSWNVGGNWINSGTFTADTSTITLNGTSQNINGSSSFYNLTKSVASADTLTFEAGKTTTIASGGTLTLNGASGQLLTLASSTGSSAWNLVLTDATVTKAIDYVSVSWSDASGSHASQKAINPTNSIDGGNNTDWFTSNTAPIGGYTANNVIPTAQVTQSANGDGIITINFRAQDAETNNVTLKTFEYSVDGGSTWNAPTNADASASLSANWSNNGGGGYSSATDWTGTVHNFTFDTDHADVTGMSGVDQSDVQVRFSLNDGTVDSAAPTTSESFQVDNVAPTATITSSSYDAASDTMTITGTNFTTIATATTDIKTYVDWTKFVWDINGDDATTANITFVVGDVTSLIVTNDTTLTLVFTGAKGTAVEGTSGYGSNGGADTLDVTAGFSKDAFGNAATTDGVSDATLTTSEPNIGITKLSSVISDPISASNPKRIPGAVIEYIITVSNSGDASPDNNSTLVTTTIDTDETEFYYTGAITFVDGTTTSNLALGTVSYSQTSAPGPYVYDYTPSPDGDGYDANITSVKIKTTGTFAFGGSPSASFSLKYRVRVK